MWLQRDRAQLDSMLQTKPDRPIGNWKVSPLPGLRVYFPRSIEQGPHVYRDPRCTGFFLSEQREEEEGQGVEEISQLSWGHIGGVVKIYFKNTHNKPNHYIFCV